MSQTYYAILTAVGEAKLANATALGTPLQISRMAVGDGNGVLPTPNRDQTTLIGEQYRADLNTLQPDPANASQVIAELVIPETTGGWWIREMGLYDAAGDLIAVSNCPPSYKPQMSEGSGRTQVLRMVLIVSSTAAVQLKIDPSVVLATRDFVVTTVATELAKLDSKQSVRIATTAAITLSGLQTIDGIALVAGDRVLVKNQATGSQNGIYVAASGAWSRSADADASLEVTPGMLVPVEQGAVNGDSVWQLVTDFPVGLGTTPLMFEIATGPSGVAAGTYRSVTVDKRGRVTGGTNPTTLAGYGITDALGCKIGLETEAVEVSWNTLVVEGLHRRLIMGNNPDGPGPALYFYCRTYVRIAVAAGSGALQQFAEPYGTPTGSGQMYWRGLNGTTWTPWVKVIDSADSASKNDAEGFASTDRWMSPLRTWQAMVKYGAELSPPGVVSAFARNSAPSGWLKANGAAVSRTSYAALFAAIGTTFGAGDGSTTFNLPDLRGEFVRGWDDGRGIDSGRVFGSNQKGSLATFDPTAASTALTSLHSTGSDSTTRADVGLDAIGAADYPTIDVGSASAGATLTASTAAGVSRPRNIALLYCIKY